MINRLVSLFLIMSFISCSSYTFFPSPLLTQEQALEYKQQFIDMGTAVNSGINYFRYYGEYIYDLYQHDILTFDDVQRYCEELDKVKFEDGYYSHYFAGQNRVAKRDDLLFAAVGLFFGNKINSCAKKHLQFMYDKMHAKQGEKGLALVGDIWEPKHFVFFDRANGVSRKNHKVIDSTFLYGAARSVCSKPPHITSDKLLFSAYLILAREVNPTKGSMAADEFCHDRVVYNQALDTFYNSPTTPDCLKPLRFLSKGLL